MHWPTSDTLPGHVAWSTFSWDAHIFVAVWYGTGPSWMSDVRHMGRGKTMRVTGARVQIVAPFGEPALLLDAVV
jgi:hypothetical protein